MKTKGNMITETNTITGETRKRLPYVELGKIILEKHGIDACLNAYGTSDPGRVGEYALQAKDIEPDGTLN
jgi:hypothetical protein